MAALEVEPRTGKAAVTHTPALPPLEAPEEVEVEVEVEGWEAKAAASFMKDLASPIVRPRLLRSSCVRSTTTWSVIFSFLRARPLQLGEGGRGGGGGWCSECDQRARAPPPTPPLT